MTWTPPRGYAGLRTEYRQAIRLNMRPKPGDRSACNSYAARRYLMELWCEEHCKSNWSVVDGYWWFDKLREAVMFKIIFGGDVDP